MARSPRFDASDPLLDAPVAERLDLHGHTAESAAALVRGCLASWARRGPGTVVHLITGKGRGSRGAPVLRGLVGRMLQGELRGCVAQWALDDDEGGYKVRLR
jgi:DNA-nicking Smr family endonuclease